MKTITLFLICSIITTSLLAQETKIKGARSFKTVLSLPGKSINELRSLLKKEGMKDMRYEKNEEWNTDVYEFSPKNSEYLDDEPVYALGCKNGKLVYAFIDYEYEEGDKAFKNDLAEMKKQLERSDFVLKEKKDKDEFQYLLYQLPGKDRSATIIVDPELTSFTLVLGESKYTEGVADLHSSF